MYRIPKGENFSFLVGSKIIDVSEFERNYVLLKLDPAREIHIEGGRRIEGFVVPNRRAPFADFAGTQIEAVIIVSETEMVLALTGGVRLRLFDDSDENECIQFYPEAIIV